MSFYKVLISGSMLVGLAGCASPEKCKIISCKKLENSRYEYCAQCPPENPTKKVEVVLTEPQEVPPFNIGAVIDLNPSIF